MRALQRNRNLGGRWLLVHSIGPLTYLNSLKEVQVFEVLIKILSGYCFNPFSADSR